MQPVVPPPMLPAQPEVAPLSNWSHFKPEFAGKPDKDVQAHLLRRNDLMDTHAFQEGVKVQRNWLILVGEARLLCESLRPIAVGQNGLQAHFRQQHSKMHNTRE